MLEPCMDLFYAFLAEHQNRTMPKSGLPSEQPRTSSGLNPVGGNVRIQVRAARSSVKAGQEEVMISGMGHVAVNIEAKTPPAFALSFSIAFLCSPLHPQPWDCTIERVFPQLGLRPRPSVVTQLDATESLPLKLQYE
jgi:hypothetical protein